jgi:hypothetical protein
MSLVARKPPINERKTPWTDNQCVHTTPKSVKDKWWLSRPRSLAIKTMEMARSPVVGRDQKVSVLEEPQLVHRGKHWHRFRARVSMAVASFSSMGGCLATKLW